MLAMGKRNGAGLMNGGNRYNLYSTDARIGRILEALNSLGPAVMPPDEGSG